MRAFSGTNVHWDNTNIGTANDRSLLEPSSKGEGEGVLQRAMDEDAGNKKKRGGMAGPANMLLIPEVTKVKSPKHESNFVRLFIAFRTVGTEMDDVNLNELRVPLVKLDKLLDYILSTKNLAQYEGGLLKTASEISPWHTQPKDSKKDKEASPTPHASFIGKLEDEDLPDHARFTNFNGSKQTCLMYPAIRYFLKHHPSAAERPGISEDVLDDRWWEMLHKNDVVEVRFCLFI